MNACMHEANRMTPDEAEAVLADPHAPHCLEQAAVAVLAMRQGALPMNHDEAYERITDRINEELDKREHDLGVIQPCFGYVKDTTRRAMADYRAGGGRRERLMRWLESPVRRTSNESQSPPAHS